MRDRHRRCCPRESRIAMATEDPRCIEKSQPKIRAWPRHGIVRLRATARKFRLRARASQDALSASRQQDQNREGEVESVGGEFARACGRCLDWSYLPARAVLNRKEIRAIPRIPNRAMDERSCRRKDRSPPGPSGRCPAADAIKRFRPGRSPYE